MKASALLACIAALPFSIIAGTDSERELQRLVQEHNAAITTAVEPINRRFQGELEQLLRRATQSGDLDTALKIRALQGLDPKDAAVAAIAPPLVSRLINSTWIWWGEETITFLNGSKARWSNGQTWTWTSGNDANSIKGETAAHQPFTITFNADFKNRNDSGRGQRCDSPG